MNIEKIKMTANSLYSIINGIFAAETDRDPFYLTMEIEDDKPANVKNFLAKYYYYMEKNYNGFIPMNYYLRVIGFLPLIPLENKQHIHNIIQCPVCHFYGVFKQKNKKVRPMFNDFLFMYNVNTRGHISKIKDLYGKGSLAFDTAELAFDAIHQKKCAKFCSNFIPNEFYDYYTSTAELKKSIIKEYASVCEKFGKVKVSRKNKVHNLFKLIVSRTVFKAYNVSDEMANKIYGLFLKYQQKYPSSILDITALATIFYLSVNYAVNPKETYLNDGKSAMPKLGESVITQSEISRLFGICSTTLHFSILKMSCLPFIVQYIKNEFVKVI